MYALLKKFEQFLLRLLKLFTNSNSQNNIATRSGHSLFTSAQNMNLFDDLEPKMKKSQKAKTALTAAFTLALFIAISLLLLHTVDFDLVSLVRN